MSAQREPAPFLAPWMYRVPFLLGTVLVGLFVAAVWIEITGAFGVAGSAFVLLFHPDIEKGVGVWSQSTLMLACAALAYFVGERLPGHGERFRPWWRLLALGLIYMSVDETVVLHERLELLVPEEWRYGPLKFAWVLPALIALAAVAPFYLRFLRELPPVPRSRLFAAAAVYLGGALGLEMVDGTLKDLVPGEGGIKHWIVVVEETAELVGLLLALRALVWMGIDLAPRAQVLETHAAAAASPRFVSAR